MSEAKFTKGPWVSKQQFANVWLVEKHSDGFVPHGIASVYSTVLEVGTCESAEPNAHLIAAAPELYEACESAANQIEFGRLGASELFGIIEKLKAALAKARGEQ